MNHGTKKKEANCTILFLPAELTSSGPPRTRCWPTLPGSRYRALRESTCPPLPRRSLLAPDTAAQQQQRHRPQTNAAASACTRPKFWVVPLARLYAAAQLPPCLAVPRTPLPTLQAGFECRVVCLLVLLEKTFRPCLLYAAIYRKTK